MSGKSKNTRAKSAADNVKTTKKPPKKSTGRKCSVCTHAQVKEINSAINRADSFRGISRQFGVGDDSVGRHAENCLKLEIRALIEEKKIENAIDHWAEIYDLLAFGKELKNASRDYLKDPETGALTLIPRAKEVLVIYEDHVDLTKNYEPKKKRENLDVLLERLETYRGAVLDDLLIDFVRLFERYDQEDQLMVKDIHAEVTRVVAGYKRDHIDTTKVHIKHVDIRKFALDAINTIDTVLDKVARVQGVYQKDRDNQIDEITALRQTIQKAADDENQPYHEMLGYFLANYGGRVKPELRVQLQDEYKQLTGNSAVNLLPATVE